MNHRRAFIATAAAAAVGSSWPVGAQSPAKVARIAWLSPGQGPPAGGRHPWEKLTLDRLRDLGWVDGRNLVVEFRYGGGRAEALPGLAAEVVALRPDVIIAPGTATIRAVRHATASIPIVMASGGDPVGSGLVMSLARPGGNITGVSGQGQEIIPKALSLLQELVPRARRIDLLVNTTNPGNAFFAKVFSDAARALGLEGRLLEVSSADELEGAIAATPADALLMLSDGLFYLNRQRIADAAIKRRLPLGDSANRDHILAGNLISYAIRTDDVWLLAATYADRILRGARPADLPVQEPTVIELVINLATARAQGIALPQAFILRADRIVE